MNESQMIITQKRHLLKEWPLREIVISSLKNKTLDWIEETYVFRTINYFSYKTMKALESIRKKGS